MSVKKKKSIVHSEARLIFLIRFRPVRESLPHVWRTETEKEKNLHQEEHPEPCLQRSHSFRCPSWEHRPNKSPNSSDGLRSVRYLIFTTVPMPRVFLFSLPEPGKFCPGSKPELWRRLIKKSFGWTKDLVAVVDVLLLFSYRVSKNKHTLNSTLLKIQITPKDVAPTLPRPIPKAPIMWYFVTWNQQEQKPTVDGHRKGWMIY